MASFPKSKAYSSILELAVSELAFAAFMAFQVFKAGMTSVTAAWGSAIVALIFWVGFQWGTPQTGANVLQSAFLGTGMALLGEFLLVYAELGAAMSLASLAGSCVGATLLIAVLRKWLISQPAGERVLMLGCGAVGANLAGALGLQLIGALEQDPAHIPNRVAYLGRFDDLGGVVAARQPSSLVLDLPNWAEHLSPRLLLGYKLEGKRIETAATAYERTLERISVEEYRPFPFWQETIRSNRRVMALQAIYSNLSGLILLVGLSPVLVALGLAARLAAGPGPVFETAVCAGFQKIPFARRSFRIRKTSGDMTGIGRLISALRLTHLPQLINVVRGEMGLFGPEPVRMEFANYLEQLSPIYAHRFSLKPGVFGWARANASRGAQQEESVRIGYDLYYLEYGSPFVDFEILLRNLAKAWKR